MLQKVRRWNGNNQISSCLLPALTSIISFCRLPTASAVAKRQRGGTAARRNPPAAPNAQTRDGKQRRKREARKTLAREEWARRIWCLGGLPPGKGVSVAAPPQRGVSRRWGMRRRDGKAAARAPAVSVARRGSVLLEKHPRLSQTCHGTSRRSGSWPQPSFKC